MKKIKLDKKISKINEQQFPIEGGFDPGDGEVSGGGYSGCYSNPSEGGGGGCGGCCCTDPNPKDDRWY